MFLSDRSSVIGSSESKTVTFQDVADDSDKNPRYLINSAIEKLDIHDVDIPALVIAKKR